MEKKTKVILLVGFGLIVLGLYLNLGIYPLYMEEPRRALIALEMMISDNYIIPTQVGELYYKKPPVYNWLIAFSYHLFGNYSEFATRFLSILSYIGIGVLMYFIGKKYVSHLFGALSALLFLICIQTLFSFSVTSGEIDLFYSFISFASIVVIFHFHEKQNYWLLFLLAYLFSAIGVLTKGFPSFVFIGVSLFAFFVYKKEFKRLFTLPHFLGIGVFVLIIGSYFYTYNLEHSLNNYFAALWSQSSDQTMVQHSIGSLLGHFIKFPLEIVLSILPGGLLLLFLGLKKSRSAVTNHPFLIFCIVMFFANIFVYFISPGTRQRYVFMLYPFLIFISTYAYLTALQSKTRLHKFLHILTVIVLSVSSLAVLALPFINLLDTLQNRIWWISIGLFIPIVGLFVYYIKYTRQPIFTLIILTAILRIGFSLIVLPIKSIEDTAAIKKKEVKQAIELIGEEHLAIYSLYSYDENAMISAYYFTRFRSQILPMTKTFNQQDFFLAAPKDIEKLPHKVYFDFQLENWVLVKFE